MKGSRQTRPLPPPPAVAFPAAATDDYYKLLSVSGGSGASSEEIKRAYRAMALQYHPDVCGDPSMKEQFTRIFVRLNAAYKTLSDPVLRREYDDSVMGLESFPRGRSFEGDKSVWQWQIIELQRRSADLRRDRSSWGARMRAQNCYEYE
ncbi:chaperone protein dnaJ 20, chloroplastic-like [Momordica charantia]|uniref:Chaperone protein dnaJ 20, chloroplastic-like n=1 Tax=Momordica charantia TaxID=3673 RepID=A0A6J1CK55_MOMCH|nr:chaperone protein dnaJ 20, chloroplastic-like [Momordica charantia]